MPINAADSVALFLVLLGALFLYLGLTQNHTGYIAIGVIELLLAVAQWGLNRKDILFK